MSAIMKQPYSREYFEEVISIIKNQIKTQINKYKSIKVILQKIANKMHR